MGQCVKLDATKYVGEPATTYNVHLVQHLSVWKSGGCIHFALEDLNHHIKKLFRGTRDMNSQAELIQVFLSESCYLYTQMVFCHVVMQALPSLTSEVLSSSVPLHVQTLFNILASGSKKKDPNTLFTRTK